MPYMIFTNTNTIEIQCLEIAKRISTYHDVNLFYSV
jgi:hypothetical protein